MPPEDLSPRAVHVLWEKREKREIIDVLINFLARLSLLQFKFSDLSKYIRIKTHHLRIIKPC